MQIEALIKRQNRAHMFGLFPLLHLLSISYSCFQYDIAKRIMIANVEILKKQISKNLQTLPPFKVFP